MHGPFAATTLTILILRPHLIDLHSTGDREIRMRSQKEITNYLADQMQGTTSARGCFAASSSLVLIVPSLIHLMRWFTLYHNQRYTNRVKQLPLSFMNDRVRKHLSIYTLYNIHLHHLPLRWKKTAFWYIACIKRHFFFFLQ